MNAADALRVLKAGDTMTGPLVLPVGASGTASIHFGGVGTGIYGIGTTNIAFTASGVNKATISTTTFTSTVPFRATLGTAAAPAYSFTASTNTGIFCAAGQLSTSVAGVETMRWIAADNSTLALGPLVVSGDPTVPLGVATKQYVDTQNALNVLKSGSTMTGHLSLPTSPAAANAVRKDYVDGLPVGICFPYVGKPTYYNTLAVMTFAVTVPANLVGTITYFNVACTSTAVFTLYKFTAAGVFTSIGTITLAAGSRTAVTLAGAGASIAIGEGIGLTTPAVQDATMSDISITIQVTRA